MKSFAKIASAIVLMASGTIAHAQYYPYNYYQRDSIAANNYARGYNQGSASAYSGMAQGGSMFMNGFSAGVQMSQPPVVITAPPPAYYNTVPPGTPYGAPYPPQGYAVPCCSPYGGVPYGYGR
jgi:hypothetical protein